MQNRFPIDNHRLSSPSAAYEDDNARSRYSLSIAESSHSATETAQNANIFATPRGSPAPSNVFATPANSRPASLSGSQENVDVFTTPTPSNHRPSVSYSRVDSPISVANGGGYGHFSNHRPFSRSRSITSSVTSSNLENAHGLNRSNTITTNTSTLYSIPSHMSQISSPPSPMPSIAPQRPMFDYGGRQQGTHPLSVHGGSDISDDVDDPFGDGFVVAVGDRFVPPPVVGDGFAPHHPTPIGDGFAPRNVDRGTGHVPPPPGSDAGSLPPPPYTQYPDAPHAPKPPVVVAPEMTAIRPVSSNPDSGVSLGGSSSGGSQQGRRESRRSAFAIAPAAAVGLVVGLGEVSERGGGEAAAGGRGENEDPSGNHKEWEEKRWLGIKARTVIVGAAVALFLLLAVGLGVGLGVGLQKQPVESSPTESMKTTDLAPSPESTEPVKSDPDNEFPSIPTASLAAIGPLSLKSSSDSCKIIPLDPSAPQFFRLGSDSLWSCNFGKQQRWRIEEFPTNLMGQRMDTLNSIPQFLEAGGYDAGIWGGYIVSSQEGILAMKDGNFFDDDDVNDNIDYSMDGNGWMDGVQNPAFWREPLGFYNLTVIAANSQRLRGRSKDYTVDNLSYRFGILYNKTVILSENSLIDNYQSAGSKNQGPSAKGTQLTEGEVVWKCVWEKTLLEIDIIPRSLDNLKEKGTEHQFHYSGSGSSPYYTSSLSSTTKSSNSSPPLPVNTPPSPPWNWKGASNSGFGPPQWPSIYPGSPGDNNVVPPPSPSSSPYPTAGPQIIEPTPTYDDGMYHWAPPPTNIPAVPGDPIVNAGPLAPNFGATPLEKRGLKQYPLKIRMMESRPSNRRLREIQGMDLTDPDPRGTGLKGNVYCLKMKVLDGGLTPFGGNEGKVLLSETNYPATDTPKRLGKRGGDDCMCEWTA